MGLINVIIHKRVFFLNFNIHLTGVYLSRRMGKDNFCSHEVWVQFLGKGNLSYGDDEDGKR
jgi:predicted adenine nucleotide alpha hydrolase (AANH) superfamily ATPase